VHCLVHCVFSTKGRAQLVSAEVQPRLWAYLGGIARSNGFVARAVGGVQDHTHILLSLPATMPISKAVQLLKGGSSKWVHDTMPNLRAFAWQDGYSAFSIGVSQVDDTVQYIANQVEHHRRVSFDDEYHAFLRKNGIRSGQGDGQR